MSNYLFQGYEWNEELLAKMWDACVVYGKKYGLDYYEPIIEIISAEQMLENYSSIGLPVMYNHWSYGKSFIRNESQYRAGHTGLAFETVINSDPSYCYIMENNTATMQLLVLAHAAIGHSSFFKTNYMFKHHTDASAIVPFLLYVRDFIAQCERDYGIEEVEYRLDFAHSMIYNAIDKYKRPDKTMKELLASHNAKIEHEEKSVNALFDSLLPKEKAGQIPELVEFFKSQLKMEPEENILWFIATYSKELRDWERKILYIQCYLSQYFYPQIQTKVINEGWATFWHHQILNDMYDDGLIDEASMLEFMQSHAGVIRQGEYIISGEGVNGKMVGKNKYYSGINPYTLGYSIFRDIKRICTNPTDEDKEWFPNLIGQDWVTAVREAGEMYKDETFILQYLSPKVMRDLHLVSIEAKEHETYENISQVTDFTGYKEIRKILAEQYNIENLLPQLAITDCEKDNTLVLTHYQKNGIVLDEINKDIMLDFMRDAWGEVILKTEEI